MDIQAIQELAVSAERLVFLVIQEQVALAEHQDTQACEVSQV